MTPGPAAAAATRTLQPSRDERVVPYCLVALGALGATLLTAEPALAALAVPFLLALAVGLRSTDPQTVSAHLETEVSQLVEGDRVRGTLQLRWDRQFAARILLHRPHGILEIAQGRSGEWELPAGVGSAELPFEVRAAQWGKQPVGEVWVRLSAPLGLVSWSGRVLSGPPLRVLPATERLTRLLEPPTSRAVLGSHRSAVRGDGSDFAELRPYTPGDRLRDLNWRATARHRRPFVNRFHRELSGDVVMVLDAFGDGSAGSREALARAARAAWALAAVHLQAYDRVGLAPLGSTTRWLAPSGGARARYQLLESLLATEWDSPGAESGARVEVNSLVPAGALIIALTHLHDLRTLGILQRWRARGRALVVAMIDTSDLLEPAASRAEVQARRLWAIELERRKSELTVIGVPVVPLSAGGPVAPVVSALRRARGGPAIRARR